MLVLTRKTGQQIVIGDSIVVTVVSVRAGQVRLGIEAPRDIAIHRQEIYDALAREAIAEQAVPERQNPIE